MNSLHQNDLYYDNPSSRSPRANNYQTQSLPRQASRHFEAYNNQSAAQQPPQQQNGLYMDDLVPRYDTARYDDRMNAQIPTNYGTYDVGLPQAWNTSSYSQSNHLAAMGATTRLKPSNARNPRGTLPTTWLDQPVQQSMGPPPYHAMTGTAPMAQPSRPDPLSSETDEDLIPTAIVIKNIPFAVKKEQLVQVMTEMCLPLPYAFNYHFDNGVFRGLAFANFTTAEETATVISAMNHLDLQGRKLRVEYKKMLPQAERDRIEREKRERRGQLEEQHRPIAPSQLQNQSSMSSLASHIQAKSPSPGASNTMPPSIDMNDPLTLSYYSKLILFQSDSAQGEVYTFPAHLPPNHRKIIHGLAHSLKMAHMSHGQGEQRQLHVYRSGAGAAMSPTVTAPGNPLDPSRRGLYRAATTDFSDVRDPSLYGPLGRQSSGYLGFNEAAGGLSAGSNLRTAKSFADLRSYTPSPAQSTSSFPVGTTVNVGRSQEYGQQSSPGSSRSNATPTTTTTMNAAAEASLVNGLNSINISSGFGPTTGSPHRLRGMLSWDREVPGPIGGHRTYTNNHDDATRNRSQGAPTRQPRGPLPERGNGFNRPRPNGHQSRGSDELSTPGQDPAAE